MPTNDTTNATTTTNVARNVVEEDNDNLPQHLYSRGGSHVINISVFDKDDFTSWKISNLANQDKRLKSIIIGCLPNDVMKSVINYKSAKETWTELCLAYEGPSDTRETKIVALRLEFNAFKALEGEKLNENDESLSSEDEGTTKFKAFMAITEDDSSKEKGDARSGHRIEITMKSIQTSVCDRG
uniref:Retrovirus-related Pol polyprotein from transposon TNT 1-94 n=1 Tax=Tanacetum cinerariifolium TaxID=118510 RepID=A0A699HVA0_TANCI|nr:retrovirus-related Pol polyprotein from transposon TNT 1-94 [Tanacetum cinerariifolium]